MGIVPVVGAGSFLFGTIADYPVCLPVPTFCQQHGKQRCLGHSHRVLDPFAGHYDMPLG
jgi:hypothetical protein